MLCEVNRNHGESRRITMQDLRITLVQPNPKWLQVNENLIKYDSLLETAALETDLIVLPEMFTTGFTMESSRAAEKMDGRTHTWMREQAQKYNSAICGSIIIEEDSNYYNRFLWVEPGGKTLTYDKKHLFRMADEDKYYSEGKELIDISYKGWKLRPLVCYDLRFPVWARNSVTEGAFDYDILLYVANWPQARIHAWDTLLQARAMENSSFSIGVNRVGKDEKDIDYNGHSAVYDSRGVKYCFLEDTEQVYTVKLEKSLIEKYRDKFPSFLDADDFFLGNKKD